MVHPVAALLLIAVDALWSVPDMAAFAWILTIPLCFLAVSVPTFLIQRFLAKSTTLQSLGIAFVLGVDLDEARRIGSGAYEIPLVTLRANLLALGRSRREVDEMRREVLRDYPGAVV